MSEVKKDPDLKIVQHGKGVRPVHEIEAEQAKLSKRLSELRVEKSQSKEY